MPIILKNKLKIIKLYAPELIAPAEDQPINIFAWVSGKEEELSILCGESFNGTWLQTPLPRSSDGESVGDWLNFKKNLPNCRGGRSNKSYIPPFDFQRPGVDKMRSPVFPVPVSFSDAQCKRFFENRLLFKDNTFSCNLNPYPLARGHDLKADTSQKSLAAIEALIKESLAQNMGNLSLINFIHNNVVANLKNSSSTDVTLTLWESILTLVGASLTRNKQLLTSSLARLREFIRAQALRKLQGNINSRATADSWHFSDFGGRDLFGPVRSEISSWLNNFAQTGSGQDTSLRAGFTNSSKNKGGQAKASLPSSSFLPTNNFRPVKQQTGRTRGRGGPQRGRGQANSNQPQRGGGKGS